MNFCTDTEISTVLPQYMKKLWYFEIVKMSQNLHANMVGFRRAGHIYIYPSTMIHHKNTVI